MGHPALDAKAEALGYPEARAKAEALSVEKA
jgi:hypothetical protein